MDLLGWVELIGGLLLVAVLLPVLALFLRRRWLARHSGMFECGLRPFDATPGTGWVLGVARYSDDYLEWFRVFSGSFRPRYRFYRPRTRAVGSREAEPVESVMLYDGQQIIGLSSTDPQGDFELAMSEESMTGLLAWLEASPPGQRHGEHQDERH